MFVHSSGASRRESADSHPLGCLKIESETAFIDVVGTTSLARRFKPLFG